MDGVKNTAFQLDESQLSRFWEKVIKQDGDKCWEWSGSRSQQGYGKFGVKRIPQQAHRISYEIAFGPFDAKMCICHKCDNPPCVRPDHLFLGTHQENTRDMIRKRRMASDGLNFKLSASDVLKIKELAERGAIPFDIAKAFLVTRTCVMGILKGKRRSACSLDKPGQEIGGDKIE